MAEVIFNKLEKVYSNGFKAVHGIDLKIADGEFMVIVGPSGCAKSTTLRMLAGLETISGGEVRIGDKIVNNLAPKSRGIAMVFQNYALYPHMTVRENLAFGLKLSKLPKAQIDRQVEEAAKILELEELLDRLPRQLSGGQAQRVAVGRAIVKKPDVFLFDEPLSNLDAKLRASMRIRISDLHKQLKKSGKPATTVYVTHDQTEAMTMGDRICVMKLGHIMQVDTPDNLYHQPKNMFVAGFIGAPEMNIRPSQLVEHGGRLHLTLGDQRLPLNDRLQSKVETHKNQVDAAKAAFYPHFDIKAFWGYNALSVGDLFKSSFQQINLLPGLYLPIFDGGRLNANLQSVRTASNILIKQYNQAVLDAVRDVAISSSQLNDLNQQRALQQLKVTAAQTTTDSARAHYQRGLLSRYAAEEARRAVLAQQLLLLDIEAQRLSTDITLIKALGGGYRGQ
uniref:ATP-binding cassette domain-containing protein n=37 Tax=Gammaproteobacteria TaxID=1236 RepID=A0A484ALG1_KLEPN